MNLTMNVYFIRLEYKNQYFSEICVEQWLIFISKYLLCFSGLMYLRVMVIEHKHSNVCQWRWPSPSSVIRQPISVCHLTRTLTVLSANHISNIFINNQFSTVIFRIFTKLRLKIWMKFEDGDRIVSYVQKMAKLKQLLQWLAL